MSDSNSRELTYEQRMKMLLIGIDDPDDAEHVVDVLRQHHNIHFETVFPVPGDGNIKSHIQIRHNDTILHIGEDSIDLLLKVIEQVYQSTCARSGEILYKLRCMDGIKGEEEVMGSYQFPLHRWEICYQTVEMKTNFDPKRWEFLCTVYTLEEARDLVSHICGGLI